MARRKRSNLQVSEEVVQRHKWRARLSSPITWVNVLILGLLCWFVPWPWYVKLGLFLTVLAAIAFYWRITGQALDRRILKQLIIKTNTKQASALAQRAKDLDRVHASDLAITLGRFIELKQEIETEMHRGNHDVPEGAGDVEALVDKLCDGVADELESLAQVQRRLARPDLQVSEEQTSKLKGKQSELVQCISDAYKTLVETRGNLDAILRPVSLDLPQQKTQLTDVIVKLKEETNIARKVRQRLDEQQRS